MAGGTQRNKSPWALTRISVSGSRDCYVVRIGDNKPVRVWQTPDGTYCECGGAGCAHVTSLQVCGFYEERHERPQAA